MSLLATMTKDDDDRDSLRSKVVREMRRESSVVGVVCFRFPGSFLNLKFLASRHRRRGILCFQW